VDDYIPIKQKVLLSCLRHRAQTEYARGEKTFTYNPSSEFAPPELDELSTYRYPHEKFWRK